MTAMSQELQKELCVPLVNLEHEQVPGIPPTPEIAPDSCAHVVLARASSESGKLWAMSQDLMAGALVMEHVALISLMMGKNRWVKAKQCSGDEHGPDLRFFLIYYSPGS